MHTNKQTNKQKTNSVACSLQANYINLVITIGWRILLPTFVDKEVSHGQHDITPHSRYLSFLGRSRYVFFQVAPHLSSRG
jgi:hypothetical protein